MPHYLRSLCSPALRARISNKRVALIGFGALFIALFVIYGVANGIGNPSVPSGDVAVVEDAPDGHISQADFDAALKQAAARQGLKQTPAPDSPQYSAIRDAAMSDLLLSRWVRGEAEDRGISVSDTEVTNQLNQIKKQQFGSDAKFQQFLKQAGFSLQDARDRVELQLISNEIQKQVLPETPDVSSALIKNFYEANKAQFQQPETRDVREIVNSDQAKAEQAKAQLSNDDSAASWTKVAAQFSTDKATKSSGGLKQGVTKGQNEPALDDQIFSAPQGQIVGPFKGQSNYYVIEVEKISPESTTALSTASQQIKQQLAQGEQQEIAQAFQTDFLDKWTSRSFCAKAYLMSRCANYTPPSQAIPGGAPVISSRPVAPGQASFFPGEAPQGLPQGPQQPASAAVQPGVIGPGGAPQLPPGAVPQGAAPQTGAPPTPGAP